MWESGRESGKESGWGEKGGWGKEGGWQGDGKGCGQFVVSVDENISDKKEEEEEKEKNNNNNNNKHLLMNPTDATPETHYFESIPKLPPAVKRKKREW